MLIIRNRISLFIILIFSSTIQLKILYANRDYYTGLKNYEGGNYLIAEIFFENFIENNPSDTLIPEATYYLLKIYDKKNDFIRFLSLVEGYLNSFKFHSKREEIFNHLLQRLIDKKSYHLGYEYLRKYDYINVDSMLINEIFLNLATQNWNIDELLKLLPNNDSLKIIKALTLDNFEERIKILKQIKSLNGKIYLIECYLLMGDTVSAWEEYNKVKIESIPVDYLYPWAKLCLDLNKKDLHSIITRLERYDKLKVNAKILNLFIKDSLLNGIKVKDKIDFEIIQKFLSIRHINPNQLLKPEGIDSLLTDTTDIENKISRLRRVYEKNFYIDSTFCEILIKKKKYQKAYEVIKDYLQYPETENFARLIRALNSYNKGDYRQTLNDLLLASSDNQHLKFIYAQVLEKNNYNPELVYEELMKTADDSLIKINSLKNYIRYQFEKNNYSAIVQLKPAIVDSVITKYYLLSLIHSGKLDVADSLYIQTFGKFDKEFYQAKVQHLIKNNLLTKARDLIDSLFNTPEYKNDEMLNYYRAFIPFRKGETAEAESNFKEYIKRFPEGKNYYAALFKVGTLKYLNQEFDSAAYYYNLSAADSLLQFEAFRNSLIALKKAELWEDLIKTAEKLCAVAPDSIKGDCFFEIGYASLRKGYVNQAIENLKMAVSLKPVSEHYYWLAEAFLGKGDFNHALYYYQKIVNDFKKDRMWYPTALFKTGLTLEMMNGIKEAKNIYNRIIKEMGAGDLWSIEAKNRLEQLK